MSTQPRPGTWTLTRPDGKEYCAGSPLLCVRAEINDRVPLDVQVARVIDALGDPYLNGGVNLYQIQDADRPLWVIAENWNSALDKWKRVVAQENDMEPNEVDEPRGITLVCEADELIR